MEKLNKTRDILNCTILKLKKIPIPISNVELLQRNQCLKVQNNNNYDEGNF